MSADLQAAKPQDAKPQDEMVNVEVDGKPVKARKGAMIIHVTDAQNAYVPRFCYHDKLPIAANCRMCLVEVEKAPKPQPACATPVAEGMKIFTKSVVALGAQKATMEFLLINHPLDCPICDQGGECELQDLALGFGRDASRFHERKRVVKDKNLGSLVSTDMTRCIHCTRCVRFGQDVAGIQELGTTGRGEHMEIGTFIEKSVDHELSGNIIDLCPVGALNSKPFRYQGRSWEMTQAALVAPHDGLGSNLFAHVLRGKLMRIVPRSNDAINETWISDRDRFSYEGIYSEDRLQQPMIREGGTWHAVDWEAALKAAAEAMRAAAGELNVLAAPSSTTEELYLTQRLARGLGSNNIDHRLRQRDFRGQDADALHPSLGMSIVGVEQVSGALIVGSNLRRELPLLAHRLRKAARAGASIAFINPAQYEYLFPVAANIAAAPSAWLAELRGVLDAVRGSGSTSDSQRALASALTRGEKRAIWIGALALRAPHYAEVRELLVELAAEAKASLGELSEGANAAGAYLAGAIPHRQSAGRTLSGGVGRDTAAQLTGAKGTYLLVGAEPLADCGLQHPALPIAERALRSARAVVALTPFLSEELKSIATIVLPIGTFAETSGTYVSLEGRWQSFAGAAKPVGESRPGWKVLRVLGNLLDIPDFDYQSSEAVRDELQTLCKSAVVPSAAVAAPLSPVAFEAPGMGVMDLPMYQIDSLVRRAPALLATRDGQAAAVTY